MKIHTQKTIDGIRLSSVARALEELSFVSVKRGYDEPYVAFRDAYPIPCIITQKVDARKMIVPWVQEISDFKSPERIYQALRSGSWN